MGFGVRVLTGGPLVSPDLIPIGGSAFLREDGTMAQPSLVVDAVDVDAETVDIREEVTGWTQTLPLIYFPETPEVNDNVTLDLLPSLG